MDTFQAAMIADGEWELAGVEESEEAFIEAYQHLIDTGAAWSLQGRIGRQAVNLIKQGLCTGKLYFKA
jgi:hypothetical protein